MHKTTIPWAFTFAFAALVFFYTFWAVTASTYVHAYNRPATAPTGNLYSQRFSADFFFTGSLLLLFFPALSFAFVLADPTSKPRKTSHTIFGLLLHIYLCVIFIFWWVAFLAHANDASAGNAANPANDDRWCCVNGPSAGLICGNTVTCATGITQDMLTYNDVFVYKFAFLIVFIVLLGVHYLWFLWKFDTQVIDQSEYQTTPTITPLKNMVRATYQSRSSLLLPKK
jgi:hypothetical protein